jgi:outer membrane protein assembly factor BamB
MQSQISPGRLLLVATVLIGTTSIGCRSRTTPAEPAEVATAPLPVEGSSDASGFRPYGADNPGEAALSEPVVASINRPAPMHTSPPTAADFAVVPVAGDWFTYRGNYERSGLRDAPAITAPAVKWAVQVGIQGYANTPLISGDTLYVTSQGERHNQHPDTPDAVDGVVALNAETGAERWRFATAADANGMTLVDGVLYVSTDRGSLYALDATNGQQRWRLETGCHLFHGPYVADGSVWLVRRNGVVLVDAATGAPRTSLGDCPGEERGGVAADAGGVYIAPSSRELEVWRGTEPAWVARDEGVESTRPGSWMPPQLTSSMAIASYSTWRFEPQGVGSRREAIVAFWRDDTHPAWVVDLNDPTLEIDDRRRPTAFHRAMPWVLGSRVYATPTNRGAIVAYDVATGAIVDSLQLPDCRRRQFGSIVGTPTMGYLARHDGMLYGFEPNPMRIAWSIQLGLHGLAGGNVPSVSVTAGCSHLPEDGTALFSTPSIGADGTLYVGAGDGWIYAINNGAQ